MKQMAILFLVIVIYSCSYFESEYTYYYEGDVRDFTLKVDKRNNQTQYLLPETNNNSTDTKKTRVRFSITDSVLNYRGYSFPLKEGDCVDFVTYSSFSSCFKRVYRDTIINEIPHKRCFEYVLYPKNNRMDVYPQKVIFNPIKNIVVQLETLMPTGDTVVNEKLVEVK